MELFEGIITPVITPFRRDAQQSVNEQALRAQINWLIDHGVKGIFVLGSNGEFHVLDHDEKVAVTRCAVKAAAGRVPVYAGAGACSTKEAIQLARDMEAAGADALSVINPWFLQPSREDLYEHFKAVSESTSLPVILYNIPKATGGTLSPDLVDRLADLPGIAAIKDSSGDPALLEAYADIARRKDFRLLVGSDSKISLAYGLGASGAVAGTSNLIPDILTGLDRALRAGDQDEAERLQAAIEPLRAVLPLGTVPSVLKKAVELNGSCEAGPARKPVRELRLEDIRRVETMVNGYRQRAARTSGESKTAA
ncbi:dihydrodipicolinate synthase family protein [Faecalibaculum rodentium]|uniref:dihydrodipicolinate synthase family protein n=1 Tax=Faecalibaculum rodentium TaxID=1702221 RepID=UPI0023F5718F|nr:dihydrodipicolinate synthase family protein [Faecalibaculum rodentium]